MRKSCLALFLLLFCSGCWDMKEINQLAIVNIAAADKDPKTGMITSYYQVINPSGVSTKKGGSGGAAVYTYDFKEYSSGRFADKTSRVMPRLFYTPQIQCYIVSERYARQGILDLINFLERDPEHRTNVDIIVSDAPLSVVMNSFTSLERVPGRYIRSLFELHARNFHMSVFPSRLNDLAKGINFHQPTIIPILEYSSKQPASKADKLESINASKESMSFDDGAVFIHARMVGRLGVETKTVFYILNGKLEKFVEPIVVNGEKVDVEAQNVRVHREYDRSSSRLTIQVRADLRILSNKQNEMTVQNLHDIETAFNQSLKQKAKSFDELCKNKDWDLLGIQDKDVDPAAWHQFKVLVLVNSKVTTIGNTGSSYKVEKSD
ncbi:spore germination protein KC [Paenibacillus sp. V4I3]|uniref:Ger(x)C family spore germination protein n=1 Tax=unclassified Paenibacillus TaxID=185978 RepID=UPI0027825C1B|nr:MULTISPECIES: Ger(x)C family spore germination C-terminal domain-containing protein [unclassified Paenibacillus]MDQ0872707.1 spore germination protein KC [Paenibacillus sp. V4I3]MDQ0891409.1 spore germination protein KC [Paenibacillus sp. V4I9]